MDEMKMAIRNNQLYWKCQLLGWSGFTLVAFLFNSIIYRDTMQFIPFAISIFIFGLVFTHLIKLLILRLGILKKRFVIQVPILSLIAVVFSFIGTYVWMNIMIEIGIWHINAESTGRNSNFLREYFFNLFPVMLTLSGWVLIYFLYHYVNKVRAEEQQKSEYKLQMLELEARALRAQMNPHFIYNCLNSIKALIQTDEKQKATDYLTTFSKLIRTLFQNSDKRQISLYDEIETCKLYTQLESMRFGKKLNIHFQIDSELDLKSVMVPALIIQPFIENAIWHGIVPKENGGTITLNVTHSADQIICVIDDDGIGRKLSALNKPADAVTHESKGVHLSQARLNLEKLLNDTNAFIETIDKSENNFATGTKVILTFNLT